MPGSAPAPEMGLMPHWERPGCDGKNKGGGEMSGPCKPAESWYPWGFPGGLFQISCAPSRVCAR